MSRTLVTFRLGSHRFTLRYLTRTDRAWRKAADATRTALTAMGGSVAAENFATDAQADVPE